MTSDSPGKLPKIDRRRLLHGVGGMGAIGLFGASMVSARHQDSGPQEKCECIDDADAWGKYDFVEDDGDCYFELSAGMDVVDITGWDDKDDETCEPIDLEYQAGEGYAVTHICAFGGRDNHDDSDPNGETYESDLVGGGEQRAAISNVTFCVEETDAKCPEGLEIKYDLDDGKWDPSETEGVEFLEGDETGATFYAPFKVDVYVFGGNEQEQQGESVSGEFDVTPVDRGDHSGGDADIGHVWVVCPGADEPRVGNGGNGGTRGVGPDSNGLP